AVNAAIPYLFPRFKTSFLQELKQNERPTLGFAFENHGSTTAILRRFVVTLRYQGDVPAMPDFEAGRLNSIVRETVIPPKEVGPSSSRQMEHVLGVPYESLLEELRKPEGSRLWFLGKVEYDDFFGNLHTKVFTLKVFPDGDRLKVLVSGGIKRNY